MLTTPGGALRRYSLQLALNRGRKFGRLGSDGGLETAGHFAVLANQELREIPFHVAALGRGRIELTSEADAPHEAYLLTLDCAKVRARLGWRPRLDFAATVAMTASWYSAWARGEAMAPFTRAQIAAFTEAGT